MNEVIERAKKRLKRRVEAMHKTHEIGRMCMDYVAGEQWEQGELKTREETKRPAITINKLANSANIVVNKNAMERARIKVAAFEDSDTDKSKVINGLIRHIQYSDKSDAGNAYTHGFFCLVVTGMGYWRVDAEYCDDDTFDQELVLNKIDDPFSVFLDPDGNYAFVITFMQKEEFEEKYGESGSVSNWDIGDKGLTGDNDDDVMIVEYWEKEETPVTLYKIQRPEEIAEGIEGPSLDQAIQEVVQPGKKQENVLTVTKEQLELYPDWEVLDERESSKTTMKQYVFAGDEIKEEEEWKGKFLPIIGAFGREFKFENGDRFYKPLVYDAIDPQKIYNYYRSQDAEWMMMAPKAPWIGAEGQFDGHEEEFENANTDHVPYLTYKPVTHNGQLVPPPQRSAPPQPTPAFYQNMMQASDEIKATLGLFDASLGDQGNESSGVAIQRRKLQGDIATFHFTTAFNSAMRQTGLVIVDQIPWRYDTARTIRILGEDMADEVVKINEGFVDNDGKPVLYDLTTGKYDVKVEVGPSAITRRAENMESMIEIAKTIPIVANTSPDLIIKNAEHEYADEMAIRAKAGLDPQLLARAKQLESGQEGGPSPEQAALMQMQQKIQQAQGLLQQVIKENQGLKRKITSDQMVIEKMKSDTKILAERIKAKADIDVALINNQGDIRKEQIRNVNRPISPAAVPRVGENNNRP